MPHSVPRVLYKLSRENVPTFLFYVYMLLVLFIRIVFKHNFYARKVKTI